jgi:PilZ domain
MTPTVEQRYHPRVPVQWPSVFFSPQVFGHGTVVDVSALAWRIRGSRPLAPGMQVGLLVWPQLTAYLEIEEGVILWANGNEFALEIYQVRVEDIPAMVRLQAETLPRMLEGSNGGHKEVRHSGPAHSNRVVSALPKSGDTAPCQDRRAAGRMLAHCHVHYRRTDGQLGVLEEGVLRDVSGTGCNLYTRAALEPGQVITLVLYFTDSQLPISLAGTTVCWGRNHCFGVRFPALTSDERVRIERVANSTGMAVRSHEPPVTRGADATMRRIFEVTRSLTVGGQPHEL